MNDTVRWFRREGGKLHTRAVSLYALRSQACCERERLAEQGPCHRADQAGI